MKNVLLALALAITTSPLLAESNTEEFSPYWRISAGVSHTDMRDFEYNNNTLDASSDVLSNSIISGAIQYHFSPEWAVSVQFVPEVDTCSFFCGNHHIDQQGNLLDLHYQVNFYNLEAQYSLPISKRWSFIMSGGATIGRERIKVTTCDQFHTGFFGRSCDSESTTTRSTNTETKYGLIAGLGMNFQFAQHWGLRFDVKASNYREGYTLNSFTMSYSF